MASCSENARRYILYQATLKVVKRIESFVNSAALYARCELAQSDTVMVVTMTTSMHWLLSADACRPAAITATIVTLIARLHEVISLYVYRLLEHPQYSILTMWICVNPVHKRKIRKPDERGKEHDAVQRSQDWILWTRRADSTCQD